MSRRVWSVIVEWPDLFEWAATGVEAPNRGRALALALARFKARLAKRVKAREQRRTMRDIARRWRAREAVRPWPRSGPTPPF